VNSDTYQESNLPEMWKREEVYLVQYAAVGALGLLLRSNPDEWWGKLSPIFGEVMLNPQYAAIVKASVMLTYGKLSFYMAPENPYFRPLVDLLFNLSSYENVLISEPACYALVDFALTHQELYSEVKALMKMKIGRVLTASDEALLYHLKSWCKLLTRNYVPILNLCSNVIFNPSTMDTSPQHQQKRNGNPDQQLMNIYFPQEGYGKSPEEIFRFVNQLMERMRQMRVMGQ